MIQLFHGSYTIVSQPLAKAGRRNLDFGLGFYLTRISAQASKWATLVASRKAENAKGIVTVYEFDDSCLTNNDINYKLFQSYDMEWLDFVVSCRQGKDNTSYDIVEGGVANDQVIDTVEDYENDRITAQQALNQLRYLKPNNQICIRNQKIIDGYLKYIKSEQL